MGFLLKKTNNYNQYLHLNFKIINSNGEELSSAELDETIDNNKLIFLNSLVWSNGVFKDLIKNNNCIKIEISHNDYKYNPQVINKSKWLGPL